jgi:hypothetical protein
MTDNAAALRLWSSDQALKAFRAWFVKKYPGPDAIIHDPRDQASIIFHTVDAFLICYCTPTPIPSLAPPDRLPTEYERLLEETIKVAGDGDCYWNERFVSALQRRGLTLATVRHPHDHADWYPAGHPMQAPHPFSGGSYAWPAGALVVWQPNPADPEAQA